jgi:hypothetical protein
VPKPKHNCRALTKAMMKRDYLYFNKRYFRNRLPKDTVLYFVDNNHPLIGTPCGKKEMLEWEQDTLAETCHWSDRKRSPKSRIYEIRFARLFRRQTGRAVFRIVLLHEMIHILWHGHGKRFQRERERLVRAGAFTGLI